MAKLNQIIAVEKGVKSRSKHGSKTNLKNINTISSRIHGFKPVSSRKTHPRINARKIAWIWLLRHHSSTMILCL